MHIGEQIVRECWERSNGTYTFSAINSPTRQWEEINDIDDPLTVQGDHYFAPLTFSAPRRCNDNAPQRAALLWADLDRVDPDTLEVEPHHLWETSPGSFQAVWWTEWADIDVILDLNKRLTYFLEADRGGWFASKLLRVPETYNWKRREDGPHGFFVPFGSYWHDISGRPEYTIAELEAVLPPVHTKTVSSAPMPKLDPSLVLAQYPKLVGRLNQNHVTDRSKRLWHMARWLDKQGVPADHIYAMLTVQPYNKYVGRPDALWNLVQKAVV